MTARSLFGSLAAGRSAAQRAALWATQRVALWVAVLVTALAATGCLQVRQEIAITGTNRGTFSLALAVPLSTYEAMRTDASNAAATLPGPLAACFRSGSGATLFPEESGFKLTTYRVVEDNGWQRILIEGELTDLRKALASGRLGALELVEHPSGDHVLRSTADAFPTLPADAAKRQEDLKRLTEGLQLVLVVRTPTKIHETSATTHEDQVAVWTFDPAKDATFLTKPPTLSVRF